MASCGQAIVVLLDAQRSAHKCQPLAQVSGEKEFFANLVVDAVLRLDLQTLDLRMIGMKKARSPSFACRNAGWQHTEVLSAVGAAPPCRL